MTASFPGDGRTWPRVRPSSEVELETDVAPPDGRIGPDGTGIPSEG